MSSFHSAVYKFSSYCRFFNSARFSTSSSLAKQTIEEKLGLEPKPKKPMTPFLRYIACIRPELLQEHPHVKPKDVLKLAADRWKTADEKLKDGLKKEYEQDLLKYQEKIKEYDQKLSPSDKDQILMEKENIKIRKEKNQIKKRRDELGYPKKPPTSYLLFVKAKSSERGDSPYQDWIAKISKQWNSLSAEEKAYYSELHKKEVDEYKKRLAKWEMEMASKGLGSVLKQQ